jgi:signal transduction histidine kinase
MYQKVVLLLCLLVWSVFCFGQQDEHVLMLNEKKKVCEDAMAAFTGKPESLELLIREGAEGLKLTRTEDHAYRFLFNQSMGNGYYYQQNFKKAKIHFEQAYEEAVKADLIEKSLKPLGNLVAIYHYMGLQAKADEAAQKLKQIAESTDTLKNKTDVYYNLGLYNQQQKFFYSIALSNFIKSAELHKPIADTTKIVKRKLDYAVKLAMIAEIYIALKQPAKALQYLNDVKPYLGLSVIFDVTAYGKFIRAYALMNDEKNVLYYYGRLYKTVGKKPGKWSELVSSNLEIAALALKTKDYKSAKIYIDKADKQSKLDNNEILTSAVNLSYGDYYKSINNHALAVRYYKNSEHGSAIYNKEQYADLLKSLTAVTIMSGNQKEAGNYFNRYVLISDSLSQGKISLNLAEMEARFQNEYKQQKIGLLNKENDAKNLQLHQEKIIRWILTGSAVLLLAALSLIYLNYRNKQRANLLLDKKNKQLDILNEKLNAANQIKAKLFGIISHDLRGPVSHLFTFLKLQQANPDFISEADKKQRQKDLMQSSADLLATMEDLLLWSKSQMDHFELDYERIDIQHLFAEVINLSQGQMESKNLKLEIGEPEFKVIDGDYNLLLAILRNLLQNAINNSFAGTVILIGTGIDEQNKSFLSILNHGEVISAERISKLINNVQISSKSSGYGLLIVKELTERIGAKLTIESTAAGTLTKIVFS